MRRALVTAGAILTAMSAIEAAGPRFNPMVELLQKHQPVFGLYAPRPPRAGGGGNRGGAPGQAGQAAQTTPPPATPTTPPPPPKTPADLAKDALALKTSDFIFDGSMEGGVDRGLPAYTEFINALADNGLVEKSPSPHMTHAVVVKMQLIGSDYAKAGEAIGKELNAGVTTIMFVGTESAAEVEAGLKAMRFKNHGGTRADDVGNAPKIWGMSEADYKKKADLWPLNKDGELVNWTIVESKAGLAHLNEIAAVKGIGVLWPGAGTLRGVFSDPKIGPDGKQEIGPNGRVATVFNPDAWEAAIQQVLSACKANDVPCGYPANNAEEMQMRYKQGFSVFVANWGDAGTKMVEAGRAIRK